jgi:hypothetical protein
MSWFAGGDEEVDGGNAPKRDYVPRFRVKVGAEPTKITFVDDFDSTYEIMDRQVQAPIKYKRHTISERRRGKVSYYNHYTCITALHKQNPNKNPKCPLCVEGDEPRQMIVLTIIDHTRWTDKQGKKHKDELKLFEFKSGSGTHEYLLREHKKRGGLSGCCYEVSRTTKTSDTVGESFSYEDKYKLEKGQEPLDYGKLLAPLPAEELERAIGRRVENDYDSDDNDRSRKPAQKPRNRFDDDDDDDRPRRSSRPQDSDDDDDDRPLRQRGRGGSEDEEVRARPEKKRASVDDDADDAIPF